MRNTQNDRGGNNRTQIDKQKQKENYKFEERQVIVLPTKSKRELLIRKLFPKEEKDFTPALKNNKYNMLDRLSETVGFPILNPENEIKQGNTSMRTDIIASIGDTDYKVIIENQLTTSDSDHIGRLLMYMSKEDTKFGILLSTRLKRDHENFFRWMNSKGFYLYGIDLVTYKVYKDRDLFIIEFNPRIIPENTPLRQLTELQKRYSIFFKSLSKKLNKKLRSQPMTHATKEITGIGKSGMSYEIGFHTGFFGINLVSHISGAKQKNIERIKEIENYKKEIESRLDQNLDWIYYENDDNKKKAYVGMRIPCKRINEMTSNQMDDFVDLIIPKIKQFINTIQPYVKRLK
ncbi:DUF4268 domain-containing protein [Candidatus Micrarchaeota archaeon]|nr:DUF4268 domain-containing protein [Candidatus Micrarchaeota archaeon]